MDDSEDFEDPFGYVPLKRKRIPTQLSKTISQKKTTARNNNIKMATQKKSPKSRTMLSKKSQATPKLAKSMPTQTSPLKQLTIDQHFGNKSVKKGTCPMCQLPLVLLEDIAGDVHIASCAEMSRDGAAECPAGVLCNSRSKHHYIQYRHEELARHRDLGFLDLPTELIERSLREQSQSGESPVPTPPQRRPTPGLARAHLDPPLTYSTPTRPVISPIERRRHRRSEQLSYMTDDKSDEEPTDQAARQRRVTAGGDGREPESVLLSHVNRRAGGDGREQESVLLSHVNRRGGGDGREQEYVLLSSHHVNRFLDSVEQQQDNRSVHSISLLARDKEIVNPFEDEEDENKEPPRSVTGYSQVAGPSGAKSTSSANVPGKTGENIPTAGGRGAEKTTAGTPDNPRRRSSVGSSNLRYSELEKLCTDSPFQVRAVKDSEELEVSLDLNTLMRCSKLKLRVPLKGDKVPIEVTARYSDSSSPSKQAKITSYFQFNQNSPASEYDDSSEVLVVKRAKVEKVLEQWKQIFKPKPKQSSAQHDLRKKGPAGTREDGEEELKRKVPFYKKISGTSLAVDGFNYGTIPGVLYYFLSHFHYDHYVGLTRHWSRPIVCSTLTKRFVVSSLKVEARLVTTLDPGQSRVFDQVEVTGVDANHCPGSLMFVFRLTSGATILHTGDFRASPDMESDPVFWNNKHIDSVYLDTTYCRPEYDFPPQHLVIEHTIHKVEEFLNTHQTACILVGAYTVGKERIFKGIAEFLDCKVWAGPSRVRTWGLLEDKEILARMVKDRRKALVHVVEQGKLGWGGLEKEMEELKGSFKYILGVKPTGWTHSTGLDPELSLASIGVKTRGTISFLEVPYSEHSSYSELKRFIQFLRIKSSRQIIPTVNLRDRGRMSKYFEEWIAENRAKGPDSQ